MAQNKSEISAVELANRYNLISEGKNRWKAAARLMRFGYDKKNQMTKQAIVS